jgi:cytochrome c oxidase subunit 2
MIQFVLIGVVVIISTFLVHTGLVNLQLLPVEASAQAMAIDRLFGVHFWLISFLFSLIMVVLVYSIIFFRRRKGEEGDGAHLTGNSTLEIVWTSIPLMAVLVLAYVGAVNLNTIQAVDPTALKVNVTGGQWYWNFAYPDYGITSSDLYLPVQTQINFQMTSVDVIHSFWVPEFRIKQDLVPGRTIDLRITPNLIGDYTLRCAELCGLRHAYMESKVKVVSQANFQKWISQQQASAPANPTLRGQQLAQQYGCLNCHSTDGTKKLGPTWLHLYSSTVQLSDGTSNPADENYLQNSIMNPNLQVVSGFSPNVMPDFSKVLDQTMVDALIAYIKSLK